MYPPITLQPAPVHSAYYLTKQKYILTGNAVFTFGSNLRGIHAKGAAKEAAKLYGAKFGIGEGFASDRSYAIPTKDEHIRSRRLEDVITSIETFVEMTKHIGIDYHDPSRRWFYVTPVGTGLAGFDHEDIAPHFKGAMHCWFPLSWEQYLGYYPGSID